MNPKRMSIAGIPRYFPVSTESILLSRFFVLFSEKLTDERKISSARKAEQAAVLSEKSSLEHSSERMFSAFLIVLNHKNMDITKIAFTYGMPIALTISFCMLNSLINHESGFYYLLLLFGFSSICDMGAYFTGTLIGKHKLCPNISPKKTIEGAVGGIVVGIVFATVIMLTFDRFNIMTLLLSVPFCLLGIIGDLFASVIKRSVGLKDFGNLIPGHGGVLDRIDSILMIAPTMFLLYNFGII